MAERKSLAGGRKPLAIGKVANHFAELERDDRIPGSRVLVEGASRGGDKTDNHQIGGARRSHAEGYRNPSIANRKCRAASRPLRLVGSWLPVPVD
jgi:hypothetical protein